LNESRKDRPRGAPRVCSCDFIIPSDCFTCCDIDWLIAGDAISARVAAAINANFFIGLFLKLNVICPCSDNASGRLAVPLLRRHNFGAMLRANA
jgi:hypothetical protein